MLGLSEVTEYFTCVRCSMLLLVIATSSRINCIEVVYSPPHH